MKHYLFYTVDKFVEIEIVAKPKIKFASNGHHSWEPFKFRLVKECDIVNLKPLSIVVETIDKFGVSQGKWEISKIESFKQTDSIISVKFGYAIHNY